MLVRDVMSRRLHTARPAESVLQAARRMRAADVGALAIVDAAGRLLGVLTDRDVVLRCVAAGRAAAGCRIGTILSGDLVTIEADAPLENAARLMAEHKVRRLPVLHCGRLVGMISLGDIAVVEPQKRQVGETLEEVSAVPLRRAPASKVRRGSTSKFRSSQKE
ncbi:MAG: CBS domain-containing protein [Terriglobales bacterium]